MRFGSVCSGIEAASVAWTPLGWEAAWFSEIEPFPCSVLAHHFPTVPNHGDMTTLPERIRNGEVEAPDVFCGGTPCQAFSVAGKRQSLDDARGNLSLIFCEVANAIDNARRDRECIIFWENVPGVLSTKDNAFGCFLAGLAGEDEPLQPSGKRWPDAGCVLGPQRAVAWRVLDAQYFGLAQRRKRVFVVASAREDFDPAAVLLEFDGVRRDSAPSREAGQEVADDAGAGTAGGSWWDGGQVSQTLDAVLHKGQTMPEKNRFPAVLQPVAFSIMPMNSGKDYKARQTDVAQPLMAGGPVGGNQGGDFIAQAVAVRTANTGANGHGISPECAHTLDRAQGQAVAFPQNQLGEVRASDVFNTINTNSNASGPTVMQPNMQVRRLTPRECERLQGFPDDWTLVPHRGKPAADGPRYKAIGNSWAVPVVRWVGRRIEYSLAGIL